MHFAVLSMALLGGEGEGEGSGSCPECPQLAQIYNAILASNALQITGHNGIGDIIGLLYSGTDPIPGNTDRIGWRVKTIEEQLLSLYEAVDENPTGTNAQLGLIRTAVEAIEIDVGSLYEDFLAFHVDFLDAAAFVESIDTRVSLIVPDVDAIRSNTDGLEADLAQLVSFVGIISSQMTQVTSAVNAVNANTDEVETLLAGLQTSITAATAHLQTISNNSETLQIDVGDIKSAIGSDENWTVLERMEEQSLLLATLLASIDLTDIESYLESIAGDLSELTAGTVTPWPSSGSYPANPSFELSGSPLGTSISTVLDNEKAAWAGFGIGLPQPEVNDTIPVWEFDFLFSSWLGGTVLSGSVPDMSFTVDFSPVAPLRPYIHGFFLVFVALQCWSMFWIELRKQ